MTTRANELLTAAGQVNEGLNDSDKVAGELAKLLALEPEDTLSIPYYVEVLEVKEGSDMEAANERIRSLNMTVKGMETLMKQVAGGAKFADNDANQLENAGKIGALARDAAKALDKLQRETQKAAEATL